MMVWPFGPMEWEDGVNKDDFITWLVTIVLIIALVISYYCDFGTKRINGWIGYGRGWEMEI